MGLATAIGLNIVSILINGLNLWLFVTSKRNPEWWAEWIFPALACIVLAASFVALTALIAY